MDFQGYPVRSAFSINRADLQRGLNEPESTAKRGMNDMLTTNRTPKAIKAPQSDGVACPKCGKSHRGGTICGFDKSLSPFEKALAEIVKGGTNRKPAGSAESAGGQFTFGGQGKPTQGMQHKGPGKKEGGGGKKKTSSQPEPATTTGSRATPSPTGGESSSAGEQYSNPGQAYQHGLRKVRRAGGTMDEAKASGAAAEAAAKQGASKQDALAAGYAAVGFKVNKKGKLQGPAMGQAGSAPLTPKQKANLEAGVAHVQSPDYVDPSKVKFDPPSAPDKQQQRAAAEKWVSEGEAADAADAAADAADAAAFDPAATGAGHGGAKKQDPSSMSQKMQALQEASKKQGKAALQAGEERAAKDPLKERMERAGQDKAAHAKLIGERMEADPASFEGGVHTPRKERRAMAETQSSEPAQRGTLEPKDEYEASELGQARDVQEQARQAALAGGANEFDADQAANQAWQDNFHAHQEARDQGIPVAQIAGQEAQLAQAYRAKQGGATPGQAQPPLGGTQQLQPGEAPLGATPPAMPPSAAVTQQLQPGEVPLGATPPNPATTMQGAPPTPPPGSPSTTMQGAPPAPPPGSPSTAVGTTPPPRENYYPGIPVPPEASPASPATPEVPPATPGDGTPPTRPARPTRQQISWPGIGFSQMYGAGQSIGSAEGTPGGVVSPAAGLAAQQVHHLLNPNIRREAAPSMAGSGRVAGTGAGAISPGVKPSQSALKQPAMKSLIAWKQKYEQRI